MQRAEQIGGAAMRATGQAVRGWVRFTPGVLSQPVTI